MHNSARARRFTLIVALLLAILFAVSNPGPEVHKQAIRDQLARTEPLASALGLGLVSGSLAQYESYLVCSRMVLDRRTLSFGVLGHVWVYEDALREH
jgi:hypothetical protein